MHLLKGPSIGVLFGCFDRKIDGPNLPGGSIIYQGHLLPLGHLWTPAVAHVPLFNTLDFRGGNKSAGDPRFRLALNQRGMSKTQPPTTLLPSAWAGFPFKRSRWESETSHPHQQLAWRHATRNLPPFMRHPCSFPGISSPCCFCLAFLGVPFVFHSPGNIYIYIYIFVQCPNSSQGSCYCRFPFLFSPDRLPTKISVATWRALLFTTQSTSHQLPQPFGA